MVFSNKPAPRGWLCIQLRWLRWQLMQLRAHSTKGGYENCCTRSAVRTRFPLKEPEIERKLQNYVRASISSRVEIFVPTLQNRTKYLRMDLIMYYQWTKGRIFLEKTKYLLIYKTMSQSNARSPKKVSWVLWKGGEGRTTEEIEEEEECSCIGWGEKFLDARWYEISVGRFLCRHAGRKLGSARRLLPPAPPPPPLLRPDAADGRECSRDSEVWWLLTKVRANSTEQRTTHPPERRTGPDVRWCAACVVANLSSM